MLRINRQTDYAIRVLLALARHPEGTRLATALIREEMQIPNAFLPRIVAQLSQSGLLQTFPGRDGGLQLPRPAAQITLWDVVKEMEDFCMLSDCMHGKQSCPFEEACPVRFRWTRLQKVISDELSQTNFADLAIETNNISNPVQILPVKS